MDTVTLFTIFSMILLIFSAISLAKQKIRSADITDPGSSSGATLPVIATLFTACLYIVLVYLTVLPLPEKDQNLYRLSLGGAVAIVGLVYLVLSLNYLRHEHLHGLSVLLILATAICCIGILFTESSFTLDRNGWALYLHLFLSLCAYALLSFAALLTLIEPWQSRRLRLTPNRSNTILPSLEGLDDQTFKLIRIGFVLLTLALLTGFFFLEDLRGQNLPHKVVLSLLSWGFFAVLLLGRWRFGWRGKTAMRFALLGFFLLLLAYFGSKWVLEVLLDRSWS